MIIWIALIIVAIIVLGIIYWYQTPVSYSDIHIPTIHARCHADTPCGGDLVCDLKCKRCKKTMGGDCASDVDCESGLVCSAWKCTPKTNAIIPPVESKISTPKTKEVHWNDEGNEIYYFM